MFYPKRFACGSLLTVLACLVSPALAQVQISEFLAANTRILMDQDREFSDWIELQNVGTNAVDLGGWFLTDDPARLTQWAFPSTNLPAGGYVVVFASGKDRRTAGAQLHTNFRLSTDGEYLALVEPGGVTVASDFAPAFPEQDADVSYGRFGGTNYYFLKASPGSPNALGAIAKVGDTKFSHDRGFYTAPFSLTISCATAGSQIRYTTNGSLPSATNGLVYSAPVAILGTTCVRAVALRSGYLGSDVDTQTYLFVDDIVNQATNGVAPPGWPRTWGQNTVDYGMDPEVVNDPRYRDTIREDLKALPSFSLVTDFKHLFDASTGIYANPSGDEIAWERPASVELIHPGGEDGFQVNCGVRIRGGFSRSTDNPKHAFRLFFRSEYGAAKLRYPLFGDAGASTFEKIDLRTAQNYSWSFGGDSRCMFLRDQFSRDAQLAMGRPATRGKFYHLYVNGLYWGLYNTEERPDAAFGASYFGGREEEYDAVKVDPDLGYVVEATDGTITAWRRLWMAATNGLATDINYERVQGNNPDGTRNLAYENLLDVPGLIDYMLVILFGGNLDAPISNFLGNTSPNNFFGVRHTNGLTGFRFFAHDSEHTLLNVSEDRTGPYAAGDPTRGSSIGKSNPQYYWQRLQANPEFRVLVGDHVHRHFFNGGVFTPEASLAQLMVRSNEIRRAMVCESARWGDSKSGRPFTRDDHWIPAMASVASFLRDRPAVVLGQLRADQLYPAVTAPAFSRHGGDISPGFLLSMSAPAGALYYTLDGSDPRMRGGAVGPSARLYASPLSLTESVLARARVLVGTNWSALNEASFTVIRTYRELFITEIMYHPPDAGLVDGDELEFVELKNVGSVELDLSGVAFTNGINFRFPNGTYLAPGRFVVLASNADEFRKRYPEVQLGGVYLGRLANPGERLDLVHAVGTPIFSVTFQDGSGWPVAADGLGFSLVPVDPNFNADPHQPANWRASAAIGGSPGADDPPVNLVAVRVNEVLTHTDPPQLDAVELFNPSTNDADISFWFLTDDRSVPAKFQIPAGTVVPAGGYRVFDESAFNADTNAPTSFLFDSHGEQVFLFSADASGRLTGYSDGFSFPAAANGVSFGRFTNSVGDTQYPAQIGLSLGVTNVGPRFGPVVINEIRYHPAAGDEEFVELCNVSGVSVPFFDPLIPTNRWRLEGVDFTFPDGFVLPAGRMVVVAAADPASFRLRNGIPTSVAVLGPLDGSLQNNGERVALVRPDSPDLDTNGAVFIPYITVDAVRYDNRSPWPTNAAGQGPSLEKIRSDAYGDDPAVWRASFGPASPGLDNNGNRRPIVSLPLDLVLESGAFPAAVAVSGIVSDDGLPLGHLRFTWSTVSGPAPVVFSDPAQLQTTAWFPGTGVFVVRLSVDDGELTVQGDWRVTLNRPAQDVTFVSTGAVWRYLDDGSNQGTAWRRPDFDDSSWPAGPAQLGYSSSPPEGDEATILGYGGNATFKHYTYYFRRTFVVPDASQVTSLTVRLLRDDGGVVYLNTNEVFRSNMPGMAVAFDTPASSAVGGTDETTTFYDNPVDPANLVTGTNLLAVEIHQSSRTSSDVSFDLELTAVSLAGTNRPPMVQAGEDVLLDAPGDLVLQGMVWDDGLPVSPGVFTNVWTMVSGPAPVAFTDSRLYRTTARFTEPGSYVLSLDASDGVFLARDSLSVVVRDDAYAQWRARHFSSAELADPAVSGDAADPDGDGQSNRAEFLSGTLPRQAASVLRVGLQWVDAASGGAALSFEAIAGRTYRILETSTPWAGGWEAVVDLSALPTNRVELVPLPVHRDGSSWFYRVVTPAGAGGVPMPGP